MTTRPRRSRRSRARPPGSGTVKAYDIMNRFLMAFIDKTLKDHPYTIRTKSYLERFLETTPETVAGSVFFHAETSYTTTTLSGLTSSLLLFYILLFTTIDILLSPQLLHSSPSTMPSSSTVAPSGSGGGTVVRSGLVGGDSTAVAVLVVFLVDLVLVWARRRAGEWNLGRWSGVDWRFLV
ncbi:hypothetical protein HDV00_005182 [Rhizophlyctis rosea]|nr:hypothetical protein HDV00_005182 [Rhizophlyctis rosea]